ncbi:hypothetical protein DLR11_07275 [Salmonella enterica subsp. salamae]|uniref:RING-type E3 ubiquitin transferase n=1 Tax=Salmonella enterica subsp. salamae TaxID=59202 RepID=A0A5Y3UUE9_SALER|nr:hypothetical protein [Salmonella enterica subsp. salamae]EEO8346895.1 hypothetical protein [Salmonella enterica]ECI3451646.1 hypothetical protein [Salmonella enterica subsp. salamae]ECJ2324732.1 hypothetical protein [Salmonella enterica subsp. salamae]EIC8292053.1 hypothetical protein [Salmonella enterica]
MFNIRTTQPSVSMQAIAGTAAPVVSPEEIIWKKIQFFFPPENYEEAQRCLAELCHPPRGALLDHIGSWFKHLKALTFPAWEDNIQCNREGIYQFCILGADSKEVLVVGIDSQHCTLEWEGGTVTCSVDTQQAGDVGAMPLENREYEAIWTAWINDAPPEEVEKRSKAVERMRECLQYHCLILDLSDLQLTALPDHLPEHITFLAVINNRLTKLPDTLPGGLQQLNASHNQLTRIATELPGGLQRLDVSHNKLIHISVPLPESMDDLNISHNELSRLPSPLPHGLRQLEASNNRLTMVPDILPSALEWLDVNDNLLTDLPETILGNFGAITAINNLFTEQAIQRLQAIISAPDYRGPQVDFSVTQPSVSGENRSVHTGSLQQRAEMYEAMWTVWEHDAPPGNKERREKALQQLRALKKSGESRLDLHDLDLTSLPPLPDGITELNVRGNSLSALPDNLPASLEILDVSYNELSIMPERLPAGLRELTLHKNTLTKLPEDLPQGLEVLNVSKNKLTRLPETLPEKLRKLYVDENSITDLPATLPPGLKELHVKSNRLKALPDILPNGLKKLFVAFNDLTHLPERLPSRLKELNVSSNQLTTLPETLPSGLKELNVSGNPLTALPEILPSGLKELNVSVNQLTALPETLPSGLKELNASDNQLTTLPEALPSGLETLNVESNPLTTLPECIVSDLHATIFADGNRLSERAMQRLQELMSADDYEGSRVVFSMRRPSATRTIQPLHQAVRNWLPFHEAEKWRAFETNTNAEAFSGFLDYLLETQNAKNPGFMAEVSALLMRLADDDALREKAFAITIEATERCEDRVTYTYHSIQCALLIYDIEKGDFDSRLSELITLGREVFRLQQIEQIAQEKVRRMYLVDPIEVFLGYQNCLRDVFELKTVTKEMRFFKVSGLTRTDLQQAEERIKKAENASFRQWFARWDPWHKVLERIVPEVWNDIKERRADILESDEYKQRFREIVKSLKDSGVQDVELSAQMGVFEEMDNRLLKSVTEKVLGEKGLEQLLNAPWKGNLEQ